MARTRFLLSVPSQTEESVWRGAALVLKIQRSKIRNGPAQSLFEGYTRLPVLQVCLCQSNIGTPLLGVVWRRREVHNLALTPTEFYDERRELEESCTAADFRY